MPPFSSNPKPTTDKDYRDRVVMLSQMLESVGCDSTVAMYKSCQQKVVKSEGRGDCTKQAEALLACEAKRKEQLKKIMGANQTSLVAAFDECAVKSSVQECLGEAEAVASKLKRVMMI
jgi:hypothetical protein